MREKTTMMVISELHAIRREALAKFYKSGTLLTEKDKILGYFGEMNAQTRVIKELRGR